MLLINWKKLNETAFIPTKATPVASGYDFLSPLTFTIKAGERALCPTEIALQMVLDDGDSIMNPAMKLEGCSGNASKRGIAVLGGVIDTDYQQAVKVILLNTSHEDVLVSRGDKLCQGVIHLVFKDSYITSTVVEEFTSYSERTEKGLHGFGSTGVMGDAKKENN